MSAMVALMVTEREAQGIIQSFTISVMNVLTRPQPT
jgi:hypothetical protein